jgi:hypothetical protein
VASIGDTRKGIFAKSRPYSRYGVGFKVQSLQPIAILVVRHLRAGTSVDGNPLLVGIRRILDGFRQFTFQALTLAHQLSHALAGGKDSARDAGEVAGLV